MADQRHKIRQLDFILETDWEIRTDQLNRRIQQLIQGEVSDQLSKILNEVAGSDELIKLDNFELDLGDITEEHFETEIISKIKLEFSGIIKDLKTKSIPLSTQSTTPQTEKSPLEWVEFFLKNGGLPWWKTAGSQESITEILQTQWDKNPKPLIEIILRNKLNVNFIQRLLKHSVESFWIKIIKSIAPENAAKVIEVIRNISKSRPEQLAPLFSRDHWKHLIWGIAILKILQSYPIKIQPTEFKSAILKDLVQNASISEQVLQEFGINPTENAHFASGKALKSVANTSEKEPSFSIDEVKTWFQKGFGTGSIKSRRLQYLNQLPLDMLGAILQQPNLKDGFARKWIKSLPPSTYHRLIQSLSGQQFLDLQAILSDVNHIFRTLALSAMPVEVIQKRFEAFILRYLQENNANWSPAEILTAFLIEIQPNSRSQQITFHQAFEKALTQSIADNTARFAWPTELTEEIPPDIQSTDQLSLNQIRNWLNRSETSSTKSDFLQQLAHNPAALQILSLLTEKEQNLFIQKAAPPQSTFIIQLKKELKRLNQLLRGNVPNHWNETESWWKPLLKMLTHASPAQFTEDKIAQQLLLQQSILYPGTVAEYFHSLSSISGAKAAKTPLSSALVKTIAAFSKQHSVQKSESQLPNSRKNVRDSLRLQQFWEIIYTRLQETPLPKVKPAQIQQQFWDSARKYWDTEKNDILQWEIFIADWVWQMGELAKLPPHTFRAAFRKSLANPQANQNLNEDFLMLIDSLEETQLASLSISSTPVWLPDVHYILNQTTGLQHIIFDTLVKWIEKHSSWRQISAAKLLSSLLEELSYVSLQSPDKILSEIESVIGSDPALFPQKITEIFSPERGNSDQNSLANISDWTENEGNAFHQNPPFQSMEGDAKDEIQQEDSFSPTISPRSVSVPQDRFPSESLLDFAIHKATLNPIEKEEIHLWIGKWSQNPAFSILLAKFRSETRSKLLSFIAPLHAPFIQLIADDWEKIAHYFKGLNASSILKTQDFWEVIFETIFALRPGKSIQKALFKALITSISVSTTLTQQAIRHLGPKLKYGSLWNENIMVEPSKVPIIESSDFAEFILHSRLPNGVDGKVLHDRLLHLVEINPFETARLLRSIGPARQVARGLRVLFATEELSQLTLIFGKFQHRLIAHFLAETDQLSREYPAFRQMGTIAKETLLVQLLSLGQIRSTVDLLEKTLLDSAVHLRKSPELFWSEWAEMSQSPKITTPVYTRITETLKRKLRIPETVTKTETTGFLPTENLAEILSINNPTRAQWLKEVDKSSAMLALELRFPGKAGIIADFILLLQAYYRQKGNAENLWPWVTEQAYASRLSIPRLLDKLLNNLLKRFGKTAFPKEIKSLFQDLAPLFGHSGTRILLSELLSKIIPEEIPVEKAPVIEPETPFGPEGEIELAVENAGIVLIAPFFARFFEAANLLKEGNFKHKKARERAIFLLQYLCNGSTKPPENELVLPKLICGVMPGEVLDRTVIRPSKKEKALTTGLLNAAINHWGTIGNTTPETLQETFLERPGTLLLSEESWLLKVEVKSYDMLLRSLPWGITPLNVSWMKKMLIVEWNF